jgi:hypothetical protein
VILWTNTLGYISSLTRTILGETVRSP